MDIYNVIGVMSGTSLDGVDIAFCKFELKNENWNFEIQKAETIAYDQHWKERLSKAENKSGLELIQTHFDYGHFLGNLIGKFITDNKIQPDFISSHGHTIFHQPQNNLTFQIGAGSAIAAEINLPVVSDFRTLDVALGGQGAPLVPIGDKHLFSQYKYCLNLGGFANISYDMQNERIAYDICPANIVLNMLVKETGKEYDKAGEFGKMGLIDSGLLQKLNSIDYYSSRPPKSLGKEWLLKYFIPLIEETNIPLQNKARTIYEHIAYQISKCIQGKETGNMLITGGGAHNSFLIEKIKTYLKIPCSIPEKETIDFKEALIFAFLGVLRYRKEVNTLQSVTGATKNSIGGCIYYNR